LVAKSSDVEYMNSVESVARCQPVAILISFQVSDWSQDGGNIWKIEGNDKITSRADKS
jgi:hypothetical protein